MFFGASPTLHDSAVWAWMYGVTTGHRGTIHRAQHVVEDPVTECHERADGRCCRQSGAGYTAAANFQVPAPRRGMGALLNRLGFPIGLQGSRHHRSRGSDRRVGRKPPGCHGPGNDDRVAHPCIAGKAILVQRQHVLRTVHGELAQLRVIHSQHPDCQLATELHSELLLLGYGQVLIV